MGVDRHRGNLPSKLTPVIARIQLLCRLRVASKPGNVHVSNESIFKLCEPGLAQQVQHIQDCCFGAILH